MTATETRAGKRLPDESRGYWRAETAARLRGAAEALSVMQDRAPADRERASRYAVGLLGRHTEISGWRPAGLPHQAEPPPKAAPRLPAGHPAVVNLAWTAMRLYQAELRLVERPARWAQLARFFARYLPESDGWLLRLREAACNARVDAGECPPPVIAFLADALDRHRERGGADGYRTGLARANLAAAYRQRRTGSDLAEATALIEAEAGLRAARYGAEHPATLVARSLLARTLLTRAEDNDDQDERRRLAEQALAEITAIRAVRDRLFGVTAANATTSRRDEARALLLLGELGRARACLEHTLKFEEARSGSGDRRGSGQTHYQLARVHHAQGDPGRALEHARRAFEILSKDNPRSRTARGAADLIRELNGGASTRTAIRDYSERVDSGLALRSFPFHGDGVTAVITTRHGGVSAGSYGSLNLGDHVGDDHDAVLENRRRLAAALGVPRLTIADQQHRDRVAVVGAALAGRGHSGVADAVAAFPATDAMITNLPGVALTMMVADCAPVVLYDPEHRAIGVAHCGRGGTVLGVLPKTIEAMTAAFGTDPGTLRVGIGPAIGADSYEIGAAQAASVTAAFGDAGLLKPTRPGHYTLDVVGGLRIQLREAGVKDASVHDMAIDTKTATADFFSDRATRPCGRFMAVAVLTS